MPDTLCPEPRCLNLLNRVYKITHFSEHKIFNWHFSLFAPIKTSVMNHLCHSNLSGKQTKKKEKGITVKHPRFKPMNCFLSIKYVTKHPRYHKSMESTNFRISIVNANQFYSKKIEIKERDKEKTHPITAKTCQLNALQFFLQDRV